jgi:site-specific recombinase XerD
VRQGFLGARRSLRHGQRCRRAGSLADHLDIAESYTRNHLVPAWGRESLQNLTARRIDEWVVALHRKGQVAPATINKLLQTLRTILERAVLDDWITENPGNHVRPVRAPRRERSALTIDLDRPNGKRDAAVIALAYAGGLRRREIAAVQFDQVKDSEDGVEIVVKRGKGRKDRRVYLDNGGAEALRDYIEARGKEQGPLFYASRKDGRRIEGEPVGEHSIYAIVKRAAERAGVEKASTHDLRRSFVSDMLEAGADISVVAGLAGHASVQTTARYDRRGDDAKRKAARLLHVPYRRRLK